jgi:hypothetical protein
MRSEYIEPYSIVITASELNVVYDSLDEFKPSSGNIKDKIYLFEIPSILH